MAASPGTLNLRARFTKERGIEARISTVFLADVEFVDVRDHYTETDTAGPGFLIQSHQLPLLIEKLQQLDADLHPAASPGAGQQTLGVV